MKAMIRAVILMRHADAQWPDYSGSDFDRPLTPRGEQDARHAGAAIAAAGLRPDHLLVSSAARTQRTAQIVASELGLAPDAVEHLDSLYNAGASTLEAELLRAAAAGRTILLIAHNPGVSDLARRLSGGGITPPFEPAHWCQVNLAG